MSTKIHGSVGEANGLRVALPAGQRDAVRSRMSPGGRFFLLICVSQLVACGPSEPRPVQRDDALQRGAELIGEGKAEEAVELLRPLASRKEFDASVSLLYGRALVQNQQASLAIWPLERATREIDAPEGARALFIQALFLGGAARDSIREATRFLDEHPEQTTVRRLRADAYEANLQLDEALADLNFLAESEPENPRVLEAKLDLLTKAQRYDEARAVIGALRALMDRKGVEPDVAGHFCAAAARFEHDRGRSEVALRQLDRCIERFEGDPTVLLSRVEVLDGMGRDREATAYLEEVARTTTTRLRVQYAWATRLAGLDRVDEAEQVLLAAAKTVGGAQPLLALADMRVSRRDFPGAAQAVLDAIRNQLGRGPGDPDFEWSQLPAEALFAFGDLFISAEDYAHAEEIVPVVDQEAYRLLLKARLALAKGDPKAALETYELGFKLWPANSGARYLAGVAAMKLGEFDRAASFYQDALRSDVKANDAGLVLARMLIAQGYPGGAMDVLSFYLSENKDDVHAVRLFAQAAMMAGASSYGEGARAKMAEDIDWAGIALADQARDLARIRGREEAARYLESSPKLEAPTHFEALWAWVEIQDSLGHFAAAADRVERVWKRAPGEWGHAIPRARVLAKQAKWEEARAILEPLADAHPTVLVLQRDLGKVLLGMGEIDAGLARLDRADRLDPLDPEASELACFAALDHRSAGQSPEAAEKRCESFLSRHPWHGRVALRLARMRIEAGDTGDRTLVLARQAARFVASAGKEAYAELGHLLLARGDAKGAVEQFTRAIELRAATPRDHLGFARSLAASDQTDAARSELEGLLADPALTEADAAAARTTLAELAKQ